MIARKPVREIVTEAFAMVFVNRQIIFIIWRATFFGAGSIRYGWIIQPGWISDHLIQKLTILKVDLSIGLKS